VHAAKIEQVIVSRAGGEIEADLIARGAGESLEFGIIARCP